MVMEWELKIKGLKQSNAQSKDCQAHFLSTEHILKNILYCI